MALGGDTLEVTYNHPELGTGVILVKAGEDTTLDPGGLKATDDAQMITGNGVPIFSIQNSRWKFTCTALWDMNGENELLKIVEMSGNPVDADWTVTNTNGTVWGMKGRPVGDYEGNMFAANFTLTLSGGGGIKKIVG